jgi:hypothetical protein
MGDHDMSTLKPDHESKPVDKGGRKSPDHCSRKLITAARQPNIEAVGDTLLDVLRLAEVSPRDGKQQTSPPSLEPPAGFRSIFCDL